VDKSMECLNLAKETCICE